MARKDTGIYQLKTGGWGFRYTITTDGKKKDIKRTKDEYGNPLTTKSEAIKARRNALKQEHTPLPQKTTTRKTVEAVYREFCEKGRKDRAYQTIRKQDSLWNNHIKKRFGHRYIDDISVAEIADFLSELYYTEHFSYLYVEAFLKMFYLIFGQAYSRNYLDIDTYNKLCVNKDSKIRMPKRKAEDDTEIVSFSAEDISLLDDYFKGTNGETAYLLGKYCGLRINECYGLKWENVNLEKGTITIDRQMQYQDGVIKLVSPKTRNSNRTIYMCSALREYMAVLWQQRILDQQEYQEIREQKQIFIEDMEKGMISSLELVNTLPNGKIQTVNSMKYHSRIIKERLNIDFKYHNLRHTYGTKMAELNTPSHLLRNQMGHGNIHITQKYYLAVSQAGIDVLQSNLNRL